MFNRVQAFWSQSHKRDGFALGLAVGTFGITFGVLANAAGIAEVMAVVLSLFVFTGASQFAAVGVVNAGGEPLTALGTALLLGARNGVYGLSVGRILPVGKFKRLLGAQLVIDESVAVSSLQLDDRDAREAFWVTGLSVFIFWNLGTVVGVLLGDVVGDPRTWGLDAAFPAGFFALLMPHLRSQEKRQSALWGALIALAAIPILPSGLPVIASVGGVFIAAFASSLRRRRS